MKRGSSYCNLTNSGHLNFLVLNKVQFEDRDKFLHELGKLLGFRYLVHDLIFTPSEIEALKNNIPEINVILLSEYEAAIRSGTMKLPYTGASEPQCYFSPVNRHINEVTDDLLILAASPSNEQALSLLREKIDEHT